MKDIRELMDDPEAYADELERRWNGLLSYRYIGRTYASMNTSDDDIDETVALRHDMRNSTGGLLVAPIAISAPESGGYTDMEAVPNPVIYSCQLLDPGKDVKRIEVTSSEILKQGSRMGYSRSKIVDADNPDRVIALVEGQGAVLATPPEGLGKMPLNELEVIDSPDLPPLWKVFGASLRPDGTWTLPELSTDLASPDAALHIGPQHIALEKAAMDCAAQFAGTDRLQMESWHVMFLARGKRGPFAIHCEAAQGADGKIGVRLLMVDEGAQSRNVTSASALMRRVD
ncbi:MAG: hypothetical protein KUG65_12630 [Sphingomonadaceae bacterium]|nr:hypothetical protein [Sphingomonadaceae bacterium]